MTKPCTTCSFSQEIQNKVMEWHLRGQSFKEIEKNLAELFKKKVSSSSIRRHIMKCIDKPHHKNQPDQEIELQDINKAPPENTIVYQELCNVLSNTLRIFNKTIGDMAHQGGDPKVLLDAVKTLDVLINGFEKLYQNPKEGTAQTQTRIVLSDLQIKIMKEVAELPETAPDKDIKAKVADVFKNHEELIKNTKDD